MTYPEIVYQQLQNIIQREIDYTTRDKVAKSLQQKRIVTLQDVANALLYFEGGSLAKELKRAGLDMTPSAEIRPQSEQDEIGALEFLLTWYDIAGKILLVGDRGYSSYALFASLLERENTDFLIRVKQGVRRNEMYSRPSNAGV